MSDPAKLLELAARCEAADKGSFDLDREILAVLGYTWRGMAYWFSDDSHAWPHQVTLTRSLDAAMALVPDKARVQIDNIDEPWARVHDLSAKGWPSQESYGARSLALALTAASLRALAAKEG